ncbi:hypothetical protein [Undibacterium sp. RuTC16W]
MNNLDSVLQSQRNTPVSLAGILFTSLVRGHSQYQVLTEAKKTDNSSS